MNYAKIKKANNLKLKDIAKATGFHYSLLSRYINQKRKPRLEHKIILDNFFKRYK